jgi:hypothetical protein
VNGCPFPSPVGRGRNLPVTADGSILSVAGIDTLQLEVVGSSMLSGKLLSTGLEPAQNSEYEASEGDQGSQAAVDDGKIAGVVVDKVGKRFEVGGFQRHDCIVLVSGPIGVWWKVRHDWDD